MLISCYSFKKLMEYFVFILLIWIKLSAQSAYIWQRTSVTSETSSWVYRPSLIGTGYARQSSSSSSIKVEGYIRELPHDAALMNTKISKPNQIQAKFGPLRMGLTWYNGVSGTKSQGTNSEFQGFGPWNEKNINTGNKSPTSNDKSLVRKPEGDTHSLVGNQGPARQPQRTYPQMTLLSGRPGQGNGVEVKRLLDSIWEIKKQLYKEGEISELEDDDSDYVRDALDNAETPDIPSSFEPDENVDKNINLMMEEAREVWFDDILENPKEPQKTQISHKPRKNKRKRKKRKRTKRDIMEFEIYPSIYGVDLDQVPQLNPNGYMRNASATNTHSCEHIRGVPKEVASFINVTFYKRYTEAYGIPIIGSSRVSSNGMQRACYIVRAMFASRFDIRQAFVKFFGRVGLIADDEETTDIPEHAHFDPEKNKRTRGLGATIYAPISTAGDDNQRCCCNDRYPKQDILIHEVAHAIHLVAASFVVPGFNQRLEKTYNKAMQEKKWLNSYAAKNKEEYWASGSTLFFNAYNRDDYIFGSFTVKDRSTLQEYDLDLYDLLNEIYSCQNDIIQRCDWREQNVCTRDSVEHVITYFQGQRSRCGVKKTVFGMTKEQCIDLSCFHLASAMAMLGDQCIVLDCPVNDLMLQPVTDFTDPWNIYKLTKLPFMNLTKEHSHTIVMDCTVPRPKARCRVNKVQRIPYGPGGITEEECEAQGGCFRPGQADVLCHYPRQDCLDMHNLCPPHAADKECENDPNFMWINCALSCDTCHILKNLNQTLMIEGCRNTNIYCKSWAEKGECTRAEAKPFMHQYCKLACGLCTKPEDPFKFAAIDKSAIHSNAPPKKV